MSMSNIAGFVKNLLPSLSRSNLESDMEISVETISAVISAYESMSEVQKVAKFGGKNVEKLVNEFYHEFLACKPKIKFTTSKTFAADIVVLFKNMLVSSEMIKKELEDLSNEVIVTQAMTAYKMNVIRSVGHFFFLTRYALDLANYIYVEAVLDGKGDISTEARPNKKQVEFIQKNLKYFARLIAVYGDEPKVFKERMEDLGDISIPKEQIDEALSVYDYKKIDLFDNLPVGFIGSPIYTFGMIFAEWEANRYKQLKDKKKLLELRLLHLRMLKEQGKTDAETEVDIVRLQRRITDLDYSIAKTEESVNG